MPDSADFKKRLNTLLIMSENEKVSTCRKIGVDPRSVFLATEYGIIPSTKSLVKIADYCETSIDYLLGKTDNEDFIPSEVNERFHDRLGALLTQNATTAYQLAKNCHFSRTYITKWLKGDIVASIEFVELIADYFNVSVDYLLGRTDINN